MRGAPSGGGRWQAPAPSGGHLAASRHSARTSATPTMQARAGTLSWRGPPGRRISGGMPSSKRLGVGGAGGRLRAGEELQGALAGGAVAAEPASSHIWMRSAEFYHDKETTTSCCYRR